MSETLIWSDGWSFEKSTVDRPAVNVVSEPLSITTWTCLESTIFSTFTVYVPSGIAVELTVAARAAAGPSNEKRYDEQRKRAFQERTPKDKWCD